MLQLDRGTEGSVDGGDRFELLETGTQGQTIVRITRGARGPDAMWDAWYDDITEGWTSFLNQLRFTLEQAPEFPRRTIFLNMDGTGLTSVESLGPGLVIAADKPDAAGAFKGAMVIVTTYGQDDAAFAETVQQWGGWWQAYYPGAKDPQT